MVQSILLLKPQQNNYGVVTRFTEELAAALQDLGVDVTVLEEASALAPILNGIGDSNADWTFQFNGPMMGTDGKHLSDHTRLPHLCWLLDPPYMFLDQLNSSRCHLACVDSSHCDLIRDIGSDRVHFLPHASNLVETRDIERDLDVLFIGSCIDHAQVKERWLKEFGHQVAQVLELLALSVMRDASTTFVTAATKQFECTVQEFFAGSVGGIHPMRVWREVDLYLKGRERLEAIQSVHSHTVHVYGSEYAKGQSSWHDLVGEQSNVRVHDPVPFAEIDALITRAKVVLNCSLFFKHGGHERLFKALASGTPVVTSDTTYSQSRFEESDGVGFYQSWDLSSIEPAIEAAINQGALLGQQKVVAEHSWARRAQSLIDYCESVAADEAVASLHSPERIEDVL